MQNTKKYLHTFNSGLICANKAACQLLCSSLLFCFWELNHFLEISVRDPWKILRVSRNSKLDPQNLVLEPRKLKLETRASKLDSRKLWGSRIEFRVKTVNLHLSGTVHWLMTQKKLYFPCQASFRSKINPEMTTKCKPQRVVLSSFASTTPLVHPNFAECHRHFEKSCINLFTLWLPSKRLWLSVMKVLNIVKLFYRRSQDLCCEYWLPSG